MIGVEKQTPSASELVGWLEWNGIDPNGQWG